MQPRPDGPGSARNPRPRPAEPRPIWSPSSSKARYAFGDLGQVGHPLIGRPGRRGGQPFAADSPDQFHAPPGGFQPLAPAVRIIDDPVEEADRTLDADARIAEPLTQVFERTARRGVPLQLVDPGFHGLVAGLGRDRDFLDDRQLLPANRARVEAEQKPIRPAISSSGSAVAADASDQRAAWPRAAAKSSPARRGPDSAGQRSLYSSGQQIASLELDRHGDPRREMGLIGRSSVRHVALEARLASR